MMKLLTTHFFRRGLKSSSVQANYGVEQNAP